VVVPYSKDTLVGAPFGLTVAVNVALDCATPLAVSVVTLGGGGGGGVGVAVAFGVFVGVGVAVGVGVDVGGARPEMLTGRIAEEPLTVTRSVHEEHALFGVQEIGALASDDVPIGVPFKSHCEPGWGDTDMFSVSQRV
jgi:hypothetical protein